MCEQQSCAPAIARGVADDRRARYVCVAALVAVGAASCTARGETAGSIVSRSRAARAGFGYDPYFLSSELGGTFGESTQRRRSAVEPLRTRVSRVARAYQVGALTGFIEPTKIGPSGA